MKKLFLSLAVVVSSLSYSQLLNFGVKGGANVSNLINKGIENIDDKSSTVDYYAGIFVNIPLGNISLQPELLYNKVGQKFEYKHVLSNFLVKNELDYISIPVMLQYKVSGGLYVEAGPQFSFLVKENNDVNGLISQLNPENIINSFDSEKAYKKYDLGIGLGAGYKIYKNIGINARYVMGVSNNSRPENVTLKNNAFQVGATVGF